MRYLPLFLLTLLFACGSSKKNKEISFEVSKAVHVKMSFERLAEFEKNSEKKKELQTFYKTLDIDSNPRFIGWKIEKTKSSILQKFIDDNQTQLLLDRHHSFVWKKDESILFQKNSKKTLNLSGAIKEYSINENSIEIELIPEGIQDLRSYTLQNLNKTLLLQINKQLVSVAISLGDFKDGTLTIANIDSITLQSFK
jgi:hypothetical protein